MEIRFFSILIVISGAVNLLRMAMFLIGSDVYGLISAKRKKNPLQHYPDFSVVIPAHNEETTIIRAIESVVKCHYPEGRKQVIVVDDGSTDNTIKLVSDYVNKHPVDRVILVSQANSGKARALNNGIKNYAKGELVMCLDADSYLDPRALENAARYFAYENTVALSANVKIRKAPGLLNLVQRYEYLVCYQMKRAESLFNCVYIVGGIGSVFRKSALESVGYYDTDTVTEDIDLTMKILQKGNRNLRTLYGADVVAMTEGVMDLGGLVRQRFRWKWGRCQTFLKNRNMFLSRDTKFSKSLSWFYMPFAIYGDLAYLFEPILFLYILVVSIYYRDPVTIISAWMVITTYILINIMAEDTLTLKEKLVLIPGAPLMYFLLY